MRDAPLIQLLIANGYMSETTSGDQLQLQLIPYDMDLLGWSSVSFGMPAVKAGWPVSTTIRTVTRRW